jgi:hypothetical protein
VATGWREKIALPGELMPLLVSKPFRFAILHRKSEWGIALSPILSAQSCAPDAETAATEFYQAVQQPDLSLVVFFCSADYDLDRLAQTLNRLFAGVPIIGCTTAGGCYGPSGYSAHSLSGASFARSACLATTASFELTPTFDAPAAEQQVRYMREDLQAQAAWAQSINMFALQLIDGLSGEEEVVSRTLQNALGAINLFGGSAGDGMQFKKTFVFCDGVFHSGRAVLALIATSLPFYLFMTQHYIPLDERMVVTRADATQRIVYSINGLPAASEYARCVGIDEDQLTPELFSRVPIVVKFGGKPYVRSIQQLLPDGALKFFCAIEEGVVLRLGRGGDFTDDLQSLLNRIEDEVSGPPQLVISCDCILRRLEIDRQQLSPEVDRMFAPCHTIGFSTYGEQFRGAHINQTLSGVAIGYAQGAGDDDAAT